MSSVSEQADSGQRSAWQKWLVVIGSMLMQASVFSVAVNIQPQFVSYVVAGEGFTLAAFSLIFTIGTLVAAAFSPIIGTIYPKVNLKLMFLIGTILCGGGFTCYALAHKLWQFYLIGSFVQIGATIISAIGVPYLIGAWFSDDMRGKAMGIAFAGGSIGNILLQRLVAVSLAEHGYRWAYLTYGMMALIIGIPIVLLLIKIPKQKSNITMSAQQAPSALWGYTFQEVKRMRYFWIFAAGFLFVGMYIAALAVQYPAYLRGYLQLSAPVVGSVGSTFAFFALIGNVTGGMLFDKLGPLKTIVIALLMAGSACTALIFTGQFPALAFVFAVFKGLSVFAYMIGPAYLTGVFFGKKEFGAILGIINLAFAAGFAAGSSVFGLVVDRLGYTAGWSMMLFVIGAGYGLLILAAIGMKKINQAVVRE